MPLQNHLSVTDLSTFKGITLGDQRSVILLGNSTPGDQPAKLYVYDISSTETADDDNIVEPNSGTGRYFKIPFEELNAGKRIEYHSGSTDSSGIYSVTFNEEFESIPHVNIQAIIGTNQHYRLVSLSTTGCVIHVYEYASSFLSLLGLNVLNESTNDIEGINVLIEAKEK